MYNLKSHRAVNKDLLIMIFSISTSLIGQLPFGEIEKVAQPFLRTVQYNYDRSYRRFISQFYYQIKF